MKNSNDNSNSNTQDDIYSAIYGASHMREFTLGLSKSRSVPGGHQLLGQAADLTIEFSCRLL